MSIQLVIQAPSGNRIPVQAYPSTSLATVVSSACSSAKEATANEDVLSIRYLQTTVHRSQWETMTLSNLGLKPGDARVLIILEVKKMSNNAATSNSSDEGDVDMTPADESSQSSSSLQTAVTKILQSNFDCESQTCIVTLLKVIDNVIQKPNNPKVRSIRLANPAIQEKIVTKGGVDVLLACGFVRQAAAPPLLSKSSTEQADHECLLVLTPEHESTSLLIQARRLLMQTAIQELGMTADNLPKYKPPPPALALVGPSSSQQPQQQGSSASFNPYQRHRYNAAGQPQPPSQSYQSTTETRLKQLQSRQEQLEAQLQGGGSNANNQTGPGGGGGGGLLTMKNRQVVAFRPEQRSVTTSLTSSTTSTTTAAGPSDGALLAQRMQRLEQERKEREEGGFTTKAMRDLKKLQQTKVYSHVIVRIQFSDGSSVQAKFLPKETVATIKQVVFDCFCVPNLDFDLYVAPPRRKLEVSKTLQEEGLVPAAKCFCSWKVGKGPPVPSSTFLKSDLFQEAPEAVAPSFPTAKPVVGGQGGGGATSGGKKSDSATTTGKKSNKPSKEEAMLARMMGGRSSKKSSGKTAGKAAKK